MNSIEFVLRSQNNPQSQKVSSRGSKIFWALRSWTSSSLTSKVQGLDGHITWCKFLMIIIFSCSGMLYYDTIVFIVFGFVVSPLASVVYVGIPVKDMHLMMWSVSETKVPGLPFKFLTPFTHLTFTFTHRVLSLHSRDSKLDVLAQKKRIPPLWYACQQKKILRDDTTMQPAGSEDYAVHLSVIWTEKYNTK